MKQINKYLVIGLCLAFTLFSCNDVTDLNTDPNNPTSIPASNLLTQAEYTLFNLLAGRTLNAEWGLLMTQQWAQNEYAEESRYEVDGNSFNGTFLSLYASILNELNEAKKLVNEQDIPANIKANQVAIIDILMAYAFQVATDGYGDLPYTQALNASEFPNPAYDKQQVIYEGVLETYRNAIASMDVNAPSFSSGDVIYGGDMTMWRKLGNSLMLKAAMRYAEKGDASSYISSAVSDLITKNSENALFSFTSGDTANPLYIDETINNRDDFCVSELLVTKLTDMGDPRLEMFAANNSDGEIVGMPYGLTDNEATELKGVTSRPSAAVRMASAPHVIISASEVHFFLAEAYQRGLLTGNAQSAYDTAVTQSMNHWGITDSDAIMTYLSNNAYDAGMWKKSIGTQKWVALYMNGYEGWAENRRLGYPELSAPAAAAVSTVPKKLPYPISEQTNNEANLSQVSSEYDNIVAPVWWDN